MAGKKKVKELSCPGGHKLPRAGCSPMVCVESVTSLSRAKVQRKMPNREEGDARENIQFSIARRKVREELVPVPQLSGAEAEEYVEKEKVDLLPQALAEVKFQLLYGDDKQRIEAGRDVLRMNGMLNRDAPTGTQATVIVQMGPGQTLPWHTPKKEVTINAEVTTPALAGGTKG